ncbi:MAG: hypothetical protein CML96_01880 [Rhodobiaceae bacterium]|nr:hypothetical protein [Rhodobiaceae bacterium]
MMSKATGNKTPKGAEDIILAQIKQEFTTPVGAISDYLEMIEKSINDANIAVGDEIDQIKSGCIKLIEQYDEAFEENTGSNATTEERKPEEYSELRHNLRTPLNAIIGYSEILIEDLEDDLSKEALLDFQKIINLSRETEKAIETFVDYIRGEPSKTDEEGSSQLETAESLFKSLGDIDFSLDLDESLQGADILIVDDNVTNCEVLKRRLTLQGLNCRIAYDGNNAIEEVNKKLPDLILLDVILPDINGLELLKRFRKDNRSENLPIIMVSAFDDVDGIAKCIQLGAQDYLPKPLNGTILLAKVISSLERKFFREREKELVNTLHIQATTDQLTGIHNRRVIFETLEDAYLELQDGKRKDFTVIMIDIDFFKTVNDTYGHSGGDEVLKALANTLDSFISEPNIVGRIGGEEFLAVIFNEDGENISKFCDKLRSSIHAVKVDYEGQSITITASGGIALTSESGNISDVVNKADKRLYEAKKTGRDKFILNN